VNFFTVELLYNLMSESSDIVLPIYDAPYSLNGFVIGKHDFLSTKETYLLISSHISQQTKIGVKEVRPAFDASGTLVGFIIISTGPVSAISSMRIPEIENGVDMVQILSTIEKTLIEEALKKASGTITEAARLLNLNRTTLVEKIRRLEVIQ